MLEMKEHLLRLQTKDGEALAAYWSEDPLEKGDVIEVVDHPQAGSWVVEHVVAQPWGGRPGDVTCIPATKASEAL